MGSISSGGISKRGRIFSNNDLAYRKDLRVKIQYKDQVQDLNTQGYRERGVLLDLELKYGCSLYAHCGVFALRSAFRLSPEGVNGLNLCRWSPRARRLTEAIRNSTVSVNQESNSIQLET